MTFSIVGYGETMARYGSQSMTIYSKKKVHLSFRSEKCQKAKEEIK
ncbi:MAG: hypothetical protein ACW963_03965 [Candidatus Sifarchaeia archaeon]|jgi:hypothetical protein